MGINSDTDMKNNVIPPFSWILALLEFTNIILIEGTYDIKAKNSKVILFCINKATQTDQLAQRLSASSRAMERVGCLLHSERAVAAPMLSCSHACIWVNKMNK